MNFQQVSYILYETEFHVTMFLTNFQKTVAIFIFSQTD